MNLLTLSNFLSHRWGTDTGFYIVLAVFGLCALGVLVLSLCEAASVPTPYEATEEPLDECERHLAATR